MPTNRQVVLASRPSGIPQQDNFSIATADVPAIGDGDLLVRNHYLSIEPAMRGWIADSGNYSAPVQIGEVMRSLASGEVIESRHPDFAAGDFVSGWFGWQDYAAVPASKVVQRTTRAELTQVLGILGINGITAYFGLTDIGRPQPGETVVVSTAAGAVGSAVGQIARILGCRAVGIAGGADKAASCVDDFGYDAGIDYQGEDVAARVAELCPDGVNVYFDSTSGAISDAVLPHLAMRARVVICGTASIPRWDVWPTGPRVERHLLVKRARMEGFVIFDYADRQDEAVTQLRRWIAEGKLRYKEDILDGIEACPDAIAGLYRGENRGKRLIRLA